MKFYPFLTRSAFSKIFHRNKFTIGFVTLMGLGKRFFHLSQVPFADFIFMHREAAAIGPPIFEWLIVKVLRKRIIYDFDDAIWLTDNVNESNFERILRWRNKIALICRWSYKVSCGNEYLLNYAKQFNTQSYLNPTTIDTEQIHNPNLYPQKNQSENLTIGWTGSHSTLKYLKHIENVLQLLEQKHSHIRFLVIADQNPNLNLARMEFIPWKKETETEDLLKIDIGIMPLPDDPWTQGKCGFKALQYMAMNIPCIASPVGVNKTIIEHGKSGFLATSEEEWITCLNTLLNDKNLRTRMGNAGREKVITHYSVSSNTANFLSLFS